ncbi:hypothetical protein Tco_1216225 [Tanacetum coccineum]
MSNTNNTMPTQTSSVLYDDTISSCSTSKVQKKTQLSRSRCMNSLREIKSQFKFLTDSLQDFGTMPIFKRTFSQDLDLLEQHLTTYILSHTDCNTTLTKLRTKFENAFNSEFKERMQKYTRFNAQSFQDAMICNMDSIGKYMLEIILHQQRTLHLLKQKKLMQTQEDYSNTVQALNVDSLKVDLVVIQNTCFEKEDNNLETASSKSVKERNLDSATKDYDRRMNKRQMQTKESKTDTCKALDAELVVTESSRTKSKVQDDSSRVDQYTEQCQVKSLMLDSSLDNKKIKFSSQSLDSENFSGKPNLQSLRNQPVVRQSNAFESERPQISKPQFASQADVKNDLSKLVTQHYLPGRRESALAKPDQVIASSSFRNSSKNMPRFRSNNMVHYHYLEAAKKKTQERDRNSKTSVMPSARFQSTIDGSKQQLRSNNQSTRSFPKSKSSYVTITVVPKQITLGILEVNSRAKIQSHKTRNSNKLVDQKSHTQKPGRQIITGHRFSPNKTFVVYEKKSPRSDLRWKPTGRIFKTVSLSWIPTRKILASCTSKADGANVDISKIRECKQTLDLSACTCINVQKEQSFDLSAVKASHHNVNRSFYIRYDSYDVNNRVGKSIRSLFDEYFNGDNLVVSKCSVVTTADASDKCQQQLDSTSSTSTLATTVTADGNFNL